MAETDIKKEYKSPSGIYVLFGEEDYLKRFYAKKIREAVVGDSPYEPFNHFVFAQKDFSAEAATDALATPPIGEEKKLIELTEFQLNNLKAEESDALFEFLAAAGESDDTVVVMNLADGAMDYKQKGKFDPKKKIASPLYKKLDALCKMAYLPHATPRELWIWAGKHFTGDGIYANDQAIRLLLLRAGSDMMTLRGEIDKLCAYLHFHGRDTLTEEDVLTVCAESKELEPFGLSNAILAGKTDEALAILDLMEEKKQRPFSAFANIYGIYVDLYRVRAYLDEGMTAKDIAAKMKLHEYPVKLRIAAVQNTTVTRIGEILALCREEDLKIKTESTDFGRLRALVCRAAKR